MHPVSCDFIYFPFVVLSSLRWSAGRCCLVGQYLSSVIAATCSTHLLTPTSTIVITTTTEHSTDHIYATCIPRLPSEIHKEDVAFSKLAGEVTHGGGPICCRGARVQPPVNQPCRQPQPQQLHRRGTCIFRILRSAVQHCQAHQAELLHRLQTFVPSFRNHPTYQTPKVHLQRPFPSQDQVTFCVKRALSSSLERTLVLDHAWFSPVTRMSERLTRPNRAYPWSPGH